MMMMMMMMMMSVTQHERTRKHTNTLAHTLNYIRARTHTQANKHGPHVLQLARTQTSTHKNTYKHKQRTQPEDKSKLLVIYTVISRGPGSVVLGSSVSIAETNTLLGPDGRK